MSKILVWDWPVRIGHWLLVGAFALAWLTSESEALALVHAGAGATVLAVVVFRILWGFIGTRHARFSDFVRGPRAVFAYLWSLAGGRPQHHVGHNPAGGWAILGLLALGLATGLSGWANYADVGGHWLEELHEGLAATMLALAGLHVAGVLLSGRLHGASLVPPMFSGRKEGEAGQGIVSPRPLAALLLLAWIAGAGWLIVT